MIKEPEIKLFGRKILLPENGEAVAGGEYSGESSDGSNNGSQSGVVSDGCLEVNIEKADAEEKQGQADDDEDNASEEVCETSSEDKEHNPAAAVSQITNAASDEDDVSENEPKPENDQTDSKNTEQKTLKKPDKILPCPRCDSMDTKFCYYNNYNVNQPRHFCKSCQRYWTAGGTMRNVPVGAGRRKNKNSTSHCRHITISEALQVAQIDPPNGFHHLKFRPNGTVLSFGPGSPLCESVASTNKRVSNGVRNGDDCSVGSSVTASSPTGNGDKTGAMMQNVNGLPLPVPCVPGVQWPFPWPAFCPPGYPVPFYWNCNTMPNPWNGPWISAPSPITTDQKATSMNSGSSLGKHSRNGELLQPNNSMVKEHSKPKNSESSIVIPKTLRIDDPEEAAKSTIWTTLGIKYDSVRREGLFKALQPKSDEKKAMANPSPLLQANPAALSRSISFRESA